MLHCWPCTVAAWLMQHESCFKKNVWNKTNTPAAAAAAVAVFCATELSGVPVETEEMAPVWTPIDQIPYDRMWADDVHWYPLFLQGASFEGVFAFTDTHKLVWHRLKEVQDTADIGAPEVLCNAN